MGGANDIRVTLRITKGDPGKKLASSSGLVNLAAGGLHFVQYRYVHTEYMRDYLHDLEPQPLKLLSTSFFEYKKVVA